MVLSAYEKAMLPAHFDVNQCRDGFHNPHACDSSPVLCCVAFQSSFVRSLLLDLDLYGGSYPDGMFPLFLPAGGQGAGPMLAVTLRPLVKEASFPAWWRLANVVPVIN